MKKKIYIILTYLVVFLNSNSLSDNSNNKLKIGLLVPFSGEYQELGNSFLFSIQLALEEIGDKNILIIPRDSGSNDPKKLIQGIKEISAEGAKIIIGPINFDEIEEAKKYPNMIFISPSNMNPEIQKNIISIGISLESQLVSLKKFLENKKKNRTVILYPDDRHAPIIEDKIKKVNLKNFKKFKYSSDPKILTGEIETLTSYAQRKRNLESRKKILEKKDTEKAERELKKLEQIYTLGKVNFDSVIIIDFGNRLRSVLTSLIFTDVNQNEVLFTTVNQWFDESIFYENSLKELYYPSINYKNFAKYNKNFIKSFNVKPNEITILAYDALGLIYYVWKKNKSVNSIKDFITKDKIKGKIGTFSFQDNKIFQDLKIYRAKDKSFKVY
tara:strand:+ start:47 stop:1201 length:1155 start_codon:yes stop_codon:yes gene_type:complete